MNIGIIADGYVDANGTLDYLKIIIRALQLRPENKLMLFLSSENTRCLRHFPPIAKYMAETFLPYKENTSKYLFYEFENIEIVDLQYRHLNTLITKYEVDVIFPAMVDLGNRVKRKWALELFDCQHKYLPQYFSWVKCIGRDIYFQLAVSHADKVFVNSKSAQKDFLKYYTIKEHKFSVLPFCASLNLDYLSNEFWGVKEKYKISTPYFLISNQFYPHKRHDVAFEALSIVRNRGYDVSIVCTGKMDGDTHYLRSLYEVIKKRNLTNVVKLLGVIPKKEQIELMKNCLSVVQPSQFEGDCSGQIIDAITLGQRVIASDIDVIKEVSFYENISFFELDNPEDLAEKMIEYIKLPFQRPGTDLLLAKEKQYLKSFSDSIYQIVNELN